jgi:antitoxin VapB
MALRIKDPETGDLARRLAEITGEEVADAVKTAIRERLDRETRRRGKLTVEELLAIVDQIASQPVIDPRTPEEIIGYDEHGLPT